MNRILLAVAIVLGLSVPPATATAAPKPAAVPYVPVWCTNVARTFHYQTLCVSKSGQRAIVMDDYGRAIEDVFSVRVQWTPTCGYVPNGTYMFTRVDFYGLRMQFSKAWIWTPRCKISPDPLAGAAIFLRTGTGERISHKFKPGYPLVVGP